MRAAAADIAVERQCNLAARRLRIFVEQSLRGDQDARQAVAALAGLLVDESLLQRVRATGIAQALNSSDRFSGDAPHRFGAAFLRRAVDQDHATAALL